MTVVVVFVKKEEDAVKVKGQGCVQNKTKDPAFSCCCCSKCCLNWGLSAGATAWRTDVAEQTFQSSVWPPSVRFSCRTAASRWPRSVQPCPSPWPGRAATSGESYRKAWKTEIPRWTLDSASSPWPPSSVSLLACHPAVARSSRRDLQGLQFNVKVNHSHLITLVLTLTPHLSVIKWIDYDYSTTNQPEKPLRSRDRSDRAWLIMMETVERLGW